MCMAMCIDSSSQFTVLFALPHTLATPNDARSSCPTSTILHQIARVIMTAGLTNTMLLVVQRRTTMPIAMLSRWGIKCGALRLPIMFKFLFAPLLFVTAVFAQAAFIGLPTKNQAVSPGSTIIVQIQVPDSLTGSDQVAVAIGLQSCVDRACVDPSEYMGTLLYSGPIDPQFHETYLPPYQNFTVQVPSSLPAGTAMIGVDHMALVGAGYYLLMESLNQTITIT